MEINDIPLFIRASELFSTADLQALASLEHQPTVVEIDAFQFDPEIQELRNAFIGDESTRITHQLLKAKEFIQRNEIDKAWKIALL